MEGMSKIVLVVGSMAMAMLLASMAAVPGACMNRVAKTLSLVAILLTLASGTAWAAIECTAGSACQGTDGPNTMYGLGSEDRIYGKGGADVIDARGGVDEVYGGDGHDAGLYGGNGRDLVQGGAGEDKAIGGSGADTMRGGKGRDELWGDGAADTLDGGPDNDILHSSRDGGARNTVRGGRWFDICYVDKYDRVKGCERKY
jgi:Ca2+-binding RTX toxin-like protein